MSAVWGRSIARKILHKLFWGIAAIFFGGVIGSGQTREGTWSVSTVRSPMGDRSFIVASVEATENFHGTRPRLIIACEATNSAIHGPTNVYIDLGSQVAITDNPGLGNRVFDIGLKFDATRTTERFRQSDRRQELFHDAVDQKPFIRRLAESSQLIMDLSSTFNNSQVIAFTTVGLKPYVPQLAQACGWHK